MDSTRPDSLSGQLGYHSFAADCSIVAGTWQAAQSAAAIAQTAADRVSDGLGVVYGLCRPPGHHATTDQFGGYCYLNNASIAAQRLLDRGADRVGILDVDYHHGNGTQAIFYDRSDVTFISIHADPRVEFPYFAGHANEVGTGAGEGCNLNLPLPHGTDITGWTVALDAALANLGTSGADALVISLGVDTFDGDPISQFKLKTPDYASIASRIGGLGLPLVIVQEGGYAVEAIGTNVASFLAPLS
jgi:acetoin utilization deacetylase AcuC-like enzyme